MTTVNVKIIMSTNDETGTIISNAIGDLGFYQILVTSLLSLCRITEVEYQLVVLIFSPLPGDFTCSNSSLPKCDDACPSHEFDHTIWENTIIHEWDLVCKKKYVSSMIQCIIMFGILCGNIFFGYLADRYGRYKPLIFCVILEICTGITTAFIPYLWLHVTLRFLTTFSIGGTIITSFTIVVEMIGSKYRGLISVLFTIPCCVGNALLGPIGYFSRKWNHIQLIISVPSVVFLSYIFFYESPRWLIITGKKEHGIKILEAIAKCNKLPVEHIRAQVEELVNTDSAQVHKEGGNITDLFRTKRMRTKTLIICFNWFITSMTAFGIGQYIGQIGGNIFWNIGISGLILIPGTVIASYLIETKLGRKGCLILFYSMCFLSMFIMSTMPKGPELVIQILAFISIMAIINNFAVIYPYSSEIYPTIVRAVGVGMSSMCARFGAMFSPFILELKQVYMWLPPLALSFIPVIGIITILFLPETKDGHFPDTVEEADKT